MQPHSMKGDAGPKRSPEDNGFSTFLSHPLSSFLAAFRFLTLVPVSWKSSDDGRFFAASVICFPCIGLLIGLVTSALLFPLTELLPFQVLAVVAMVLQAGISGFLHLDGLADSGDGLLSSRPRSRALEIMRDSHTGAMGMISVVFVLLGKYAALSALDGTYFFMAVFFMPLAGRTAIVLSMAVLPYARSGRGLGRLFYSEDCRKTAVAAFLFCTLITGIISFSYTLHIISAILLTVAGFSLWCLKKLGGATGDTLGAVCELTELTTAVSIVLIFQAH